MVQSKWNEVKTSMCRLIAAFKLVGKDFRNANFEECIRKNAYVNFNWAGDGPLRDRILSELNHYDNFHWLGSLEHPDKVREYLSEIDVYALVTGMDLAPLSLKEAQLMRKPVIATDVGGNPEMMVNGKTGFLTEKGNPEQLIEKISTLLSDEDLAKKMGSEGRKFVEETFNWELITKNFIKIVNSHLK